MEAPASNDVEPHISLSHPSTIVIVGPSGCGKTTLVANILSDIYSIEPPPERIIYFYSIFQPYFRTIFEQTKASRNVDIIFTEGIDESIMQIANAKNIPSLVIFDDLFREANNSEFVSKLFCVGSHHLNMSIILIQQNLFPRGKFSVDILRNTHYLILFGQPADKTSLHILASRLEPNNQKFLLQLFDEVLDKKFGYLIIDFRSPVKQLKYRTGIGKDLGFCYSIKDKQKNKTK